MDFGLGLVLSFTDNASTGMNTAINSLNQLTETASQAGSMFFNAGKNIVSSLSQVISKVNATGQTLMYAENQLGKLYEGSGKTGKDVLNDISNYAKASIFDFEQLIPVVTMLKANGIEAFDMIASSTGNANQTLMDYAADLASFNPQMKNAYGTGIQAAMGALNEYIAEGNARSLKAGASLDITALLGEDKGATIEERSRQVADLMEQLNMVGMTAQLAQSPMVKLSNMGDTLFQFLGMISQSGVYDKFNEFISKFAEYIMAIPDDELQNVAQVIGDSLITIMQPLEWVVNKILALADGLRELVSSNPKLIKIATIGVAIVGVLLLLGGVVLKVTSALSGFSLFVLTFSQSFANIGSLVRVGSLSILSALIPLTATIGLLALAWKSDFASIGSNTTYFVSNLVNSFKTASQAVNGSVSDLSNTLSNLRSKGDFFSNLTIGIMKVMMVFKSLSDAWNDYELSEDNYLKAKELGILPLIEAILNLKYRFDIFKQGFSEGWKEIGDNVRNAVMGFLDNIEGTALESLVDNLTVFLQKLSGGDTQAWYDFGKSFAEFTAKAVVFFTVLSSFRRVVSIFSGIFKVVQPLVGLIMAHPVVAVIVGIITALGILYNKSESFRNLVNSVFEELKQIAKETLIGIMPLITNVIEAFKQFLPQIISVFQKLMGAIAPIIENIMGLFVQIVPVIAGIIGSVINTIISLMPTIMNVIMTVVNILTTMYEIIGGLVEIAVPFIVDIISMVGSLVSDVLPLVADLLSNVVDAVMNLVNLVLPMIKSIIQAILPITKTIANIISTIVAKLIPVIKSVVSVVSNIIKMIIDVITPIITVVMQIVEMIIVILAPIVDIILQAVGFIIDIILGIVQVVVSVIESIVAVITGIVNVIMSIVNVIVQIVMSIVAVIVGIVTTIIETVVSIISGIIYVVQSIWDFIVNTFSNAVGFFSDVFTSVFEVISGIFNNIADFFTEVWNNIITLFNTIGDVISGAIKGAINTVLEGAVGIINGFISAINLAIGVINAIPNVEIKKLTKLEVPALAQGGVIEKPTMALVGEAGTEAVMPLENNTGWIGVLANMITTQMENIRPANTSQMTTNNQGDTNQKYLTNNNTSNTTYEGNTDNSVVFNQGAIQVNVQNASEEEARMMAQKIMEYIKRQQQLDRMTSYA